jgi:hypothetical protein
VNSFATGIGGALIAECLERLAREGKMHLLGIDEVPTILQTSAD